MTTTKHYTLRKWEHPTTKEIRIYVNSERLGRGAKVYFFADRDFADFKTQAESLVSKRQAITIAEQIGEEYNGDWAAMLQDARF